MANIRLTIQHNNVLYEPPIEDGVKIEWERSGTPGKLTFTTIKVEGLAFQEGDQVCFYYDDKPVFVGYVFTKKRDKEHHIQVTCYDQLRYLKNKYTYVFENKTATQIVTAMCNDFGLQLGELDNTAYVIPAIVEENKAAIDIILSVLEETLLNTGNMFVLCDEAGKIQIRNVANLVSSTLIYKDSAENFDYSSSIDNETYNNVVLYYKDNNEKIQIYTATSPSKVKQWGLLRHFEEVTTPTVGQSKANTLLKLYSKKTRELKVSGAFGDMSVRGGTLIPVKLYLGDIEANNYMLVEKVIHKFDRDHHTMDLTLDGHWEDSADDIVSETIGDISNTDTSDSAKITTKKVMLEIDSTGDIGRRNDFLVQYTCDGKTVSKSGNSYFSAKCDVGTTATVTIRPERDYSYQETVVLGAGSVQTEMNDKFRCIMSQPVFILIEWQDNTTVPPKRNIGGGSFNERSVGGGSF